MTAMLQDGLNPYISGHVVIWKIALMMEFSENVAACTVHV